MTCKIELIEHRPGVPAFKVSYDDIELFTIFSASMNLIEQVEEHLPKMVDDLVGCLEGCRAHAKPLEWNEEHSWIPSDEFVNARDGALFLIDRFMVDHFNLKSKWTMKNLWMNSRAIVSDMPGGIEIHPMVGNILKTGNVKSFYQRTVTLANGRVYHIKDTGQPYENGVGGWKILSEDSRFSNGLVFIDFSPSMVEVENFLKAAARLGPLPPV